MSKRVNPLKGKGYHAQKIGHARREAGADWEYLYKRAKSLPPFTPEREKHYLNLIHNVPSVDPLHSMLGPADEVIPTDAMRKSIRQKFIRHNIRLVMSRVKRNRSYNDPLTMPLVSAGVEGLVIAVDKFDVSRNIRFSTYATTWIDSKIKKDLKFYLKELHPGLTPLGDGFEERKKTLKKIFKEVPGEEEIFNSLKWTHAQKTQYLTGHDVIVKVHLDSLPEKDRNHKNLIDTSDDPQNLAAEADLVDQLREAIARLGEREAIVMIALKGLFGCKQQSYKEVSKKLEISVTTVKKTETKAMNKLHVLLRKIRPSILGDNFE